jgi:hypothetical protein
MKDVAADLGITRETLRLWGCAPGQWTQVDDLFAAMRKSGLDFTVARGDRALRKLYLQDPQYGSLGYDGFHDWPLLQGRYTLAVLFEYAATLAPSTSSTFRPSASARTTATTGAATTSTNSPAMTACCAAPEPARRVRHRPRPAYIPAPTPVDKDCRCIKVLPNFDIVALDGLCPADALPPCSAC